MKGIGIFTIKKIFTDKLILEEIALKVVGNSAKSIILTFLGIPFTLKIFSALSIDTIQVLIETLGIGRNGRDSVKDSVSVCEAEGAGSNPARGPNKIYMKKYK